MLLKSGLPRLVVRKSNKGLQVQLITYEPNGDKILATVRASDLKKAGWELGTSNIPAAYLTGYLLASKAKGKVSNDVILDIGLQKHHKGGRLYAAVKGCVDGGITVRCSPDVLPTENRLNGEHIDTSMPSKVADMKINIMK